LWIPTIVCHVKYAWVLVIRGCLHNARNVLQSLPARQQRGADQTMKCRYHLTCFLYDPASQCCRNAEMAEYCSGIHRPDGGYVSHGTPRAKTSRGLEGT